MSSGPQSYLAQVGTAPFSVSDEALFIIGAALTANGGITVAYVMPE